jgi:hypothetical protein
MPRSKRHSCLPRHRGLAALGAALLCGPAAHARSITGICPDGSIFIVSRTAAIPCSGAKQVEPQDVPPLKPEFLPRPYGWERFNQEKDPNNPYNLVDTLRSGEPPSQPVQGAPNPGPEANGGPVSAPATPPVAAAPQHDRLDLGLAEGDLGDLSDIVELMQAHAPAGVVRRDAVGNPRLSVRVARSAAFDARMQVALERAGEPSAGTVVLFDAVAEAPESFYGNLTFVQGHAAFHPDTQNPAQFGVLRGALGELSPGDSVLGYAVLPAQVDLSQPLDIYWNDLQITATLQP